MERAGSESGRQAPVERLWERSREERKETNRELSTRTWEEGMRDQAGENGESQGSESGEGGTEEATVRRRREERGKEETEAE